MRKPTQATIAKAARSPAFAMLNGIPPSLARKAVASAAKPAAPSKAKHK